MKKAMEMDVVDAIALKGVVAVLEIQDEKKAVAVAKALVAGGITAIELALRTPAAIPSIELIHENVPEMMIGIGTIIKPGQACQVKKLGASFGVAPGFNPNIVEEALECELPFAPGVSTASEIEGAIELGCDFLKFFPAVPIGGIDYLKAVNAPYSYLNLRYFPLGGVNLANMVHFASYKPVVAIGGSWIAKKDAIAADDYEGIAKEPMKLLAFGKN